MSAAALESATQEPFDLLISDISALELRASGKAFFEQFR